MSHPGKKKIVTGRVTNKKNSRDPNTLAPPDIKVVSPLVLITCSRPIYIALGLSIVSSTDQGHTGNQ